ncbi:MAG: thiamine pyrophosphate-dependent enzyme, partial [Myxococcota bacterium]
MAVELLDSQLKSRHLDLAARQLRQRGLGYYTIGSSGHEGNAAVAAALGVADPALLHYRSGAFFVQRARMAHGPELRGDDRATRDALYHVLLGMTASRDEPIAGGRHKVFGSAPLAIWPQTSTIASHLPKAVGMAFAHERKKRLGLADIPADIPADAPAGEPPDDAIVVCSFGDASANHSTAVGAINTACLSAYRRMPMPVLFVCEDNGLGISVPSPRGWIADSYRDRPGLRYFYGDGCDLVSAMAAARAAVAHVRQQRAPAFLHLGMVRLMG